MKLTTSVCLLLLLLGPFPEVSAAPQRHGEVTPLTTVPDGWEAVPHSLRHSPDRRHFAFVVTRGFDTAVVVDGDLQPTFEGLDPKTLLFAPVGGRVAYVVNGGEGPFVVCDGEAHAVLGSRIEHLLFSANGEHLSYVVHDASSGEHRRVPVLDGAAREVQGFLQLPRSGGPLTSPDGSKLAYVDYVRGEDRSYALHVVFGDVRGPALTQAPVDYDKGAGLAFDAQGERLAYAARTAAGHALHVLGADGARELPAGGEVTGLWFSPSGELWHAERGEGRGARLFRDGEPVTESFLPYGHVDRLAWAPDGSGPLYVTLNAGGRPQLELDGEEVAGSLDVAVGRHALLTGGRPAFVRRHAASDTECWVVGGTRGELSSKAGPLLLSEDGGTFAYVATDKSRPQRLVVNGAVLYPDDAPLGTVSVSPDGSRIAYQVGDPLGRAVVVLDVAKGERELHKLAGHRSEMGVPVFSPDSRHVAWSSRVTVQKGHRSARAWVLVIDGEPAGDVFEDLQHYAFRGGALEVFASERRSSGTTDVRRVTYTLDAEVEAPVAAAPAAPPAGVRVHEHALTWMAAPVRPISGLRPFVGGHDPLNETSEPFDARMLIDDGRVLWLEGDGRVTVLAEHLPADLRRRLAPRADWAYGDEVEAERARRRDAFAQRVVPLYGYQDARDVFARLCDPERNPWDVVQVGAVGRTLHLQGRDHRGQPVRARLVGGELEDWTPWQEGLQASRARWEMLFPEGLVSLSDRGEVLASDGTGPARKAGSALRLRHELLPYGGFAYRREQDGRRFLGFGDPTGVRSEEWTFPEPGAAVGWAGARGASFLMVVCERAGEERVRLRVLAPDAGGVREVTAPIEWTLAQVAQTRVLEDLAQRALHGRGDVRAVEAALLSDRYLLVGHAGAFLPRKADERSAYDLVDLRAERVLVGAVPIAANERSVRFGEQFVALRGQDAEGRPRWLQRQAVGAPRVRSVELVEEEGAGYSLAFREEPFGDEDAWSALLGRTDKRWPGHSTGKRELLFRLLSVGENGAWFLVPSLERLDGGEVQSTQSLVFVELDALLGGKTSKPAVAEASAPKPRAPSEGAAEKPRAPGTQPEPEAGDAGLGDLKKLLDKGEKAKKKLKEKKLPLPGWDG